MATLVLTTVGRVIGGPIGGALGALAGQAIDGRLFRGAARDGPRLTELAVQTSSYGTQLPRLFGTIRVAGTVIWSTDLIETRTSSRAGKGQPGTNTYSYAASFAVALSARPILGVRRIWAEGKLLRGGAGDWKGRTGFRLHLGGEEQAVDPLIASAMGTTPAYRGIAYAVFEGMQLADYGNRIPSLTFEVEADAGPVASGVVAAELADEVVAEGGMMLGGFAAAGGNVRGVLETLAVLDGGWWRADGARLVRQRHAGEVLTVADAGIGTRRRQRTVAALSGVAREVIVAHHDPARDYQIGVQRVRRAGGGERIERVELPAVIDAAAAKAVAGGLIARGESERTRRQVGVGLEGLGIAPGSVVRVAGEAGIWRVERSSVTGWAITLELVPIVAAPLTAGASSGAVAGAADVRAGRTIVMALELPGLEDVPLAAPRISVVACGEGAGWRQAGLLYSLDDGVSWLPAGGTAAPAVIGRIVVPPVAASAWLEDRRSRAVVALQRADMVLGDADAAMLAAGSNLAMLGDELVQYGSAVPIGDARWLLSDLRRGVRGTEAAIGSQRVGDRFVLLERDAVAAIDLPVSAIGRSVRVLASGVGDTEPVAASVVVTGVSVAPPAPVHLVAGSDADGGLSIAWTRRSRAGWSWNDGPDAPIGEEAEAYRVTVSAAGSERTYDTASPFLRLSGADRPAGTAAVRVVQRGTLASSAAAELILDGA